MNNLISENLEEVGIELTAPIDDYLLSIANSLQRVQKQLNNNKVLSVDGQSFTTYQLPQLEFELKMMVHLEDTADNEYGNVTVLKAVPTSAVNKVSHTDELTESSTIKGVFVAVPSDLGTPPPVVKTFIEKVNGKYRIAVYLRSAVGEFIPNTPVQFNVHKELTSRLNGGKAVPETFSMNPGQVRTDEHGMSVANLVISDESKDIKQLAIMVDVAGKTETLVVELNS